MSVPKSVVVTFLVVCATLLPGSAFAGTQIDFTNGGGTISGSASAGLSLSGSTLIAVSGWNGGGLVSGNLGTLTFSTGALTSGSLDMGGTLAGGGSFTIAGNGTDGISGTLFSGMFVGPVTWQLVTLANGTHNYTLTGVVSGNTNGVAADAVTVQLTINTGKGFFDGSTTISSGDTNVVIGSVPEPSTLALFGTGILSMFGTLRRKIMR
jgi:hypothetical protein